MITLTIVRHGESMDNLRAVWAGWKDAPLSNHGMNQAAALGAAFATTPVNRIFASPLKRALWTAQQIEKQNRAEPTPTLETSPLLREQHFGRAEGEPFGTREGDGYFRKPGRTFTFPEGESLDDVRVRAEEAVAKFIEPALKEAAGKPPGTLHVVVVAHGIFNHEFIGAILSRRPEGVENWYYRGMTNGEAEDTPIDTAYYNGRPPILVNTIATDVTTHLADVHRQGGGIGSTAHDERQKDIRAFFSGASAE